MRAAIGGRWAVSLLGYFLAAPVSLLVLFTTVPEAFWMRDGWALGLLAGVTSYLVAGAVLWLASVSVLRKRRTRPASIWLVASVGAVAWGLRSTYIAWFIALNDLPNYASPVTRTVNGALAGAVLVPGFAWLLASIDGFRRERQTLIRELVAREAQTEKAQVYLDVMRSAVVAVLRRTVDEEFSQLPQDPSDPAFIPAVDELSRRMSQDLPRSLWRQSIADSRLRVQQVIALTARRPLALWPIPIMFGTGVVFITRLVSPTDALLMLLATSAWAVMAVLLVNRWSIRIAARIGPTLTVLLGAILMAMSGLVFYLAAGLFPLAPEPRMTLAIVAGFEFAFFSISAAVGRAVSLDRRQARESLRESISAADLRSMALAEEEDVLRRELATILHGTIGANLTAASMRLRRSIDAGDTQAALEALHEARRMVTLELSSPSVSPKTDVGELLQRTADTWRGFVAITGTSNCESPFPPSVYRSIDDVVTEGVRNAIRHGEATRIDVDITQYDEYIVVTVIDDGRGSPTTEPGLGTQIFDAISATKWSRTPNPAGGSTLTVELAFASTPEP